MEIKTVTLHKLQKNQSRSRLEYVNVSTPNINNKPEEVPVVVKSPPKRKKLDSLNQLISTLDKLPEDNMSFRSKLPSQFMHTGDIVVKNQHNTIDHKSKLQNTVSSFQETFQSQATPVETDKRSSLAMNAPIIGSKYNRNEYR